MGKNIIIFSDGTGQRGGLLFDENRTNIYKIFRATRCAPDSTINPAEQVAFYDPGLGTLPLGHDLIVTIGRRIYNVVSQALGIGLTGNIIDCYAAIIRLWRPGDRIFLLGFSRGAYTVRCLAGVLKFCGVPTQCGDKPLARDDASSKEIARIAVKRVYQFTELRVSKIRTERQESLSIKRDALARQFRQRYHSGDQDVSNAEPYFIGVFDTVASLSNPQAILIFALGGVIALAATSLFLWLAGLPFWLTLGSLVIAIAVLAVIANVLSRVRFNSLSRFGAEPHLTEARMRFYDHDLSEHVPFARHAISIDECRASFERVIWGAKDQTKTDLVQKWFSGNHADIGGGYPENESRLSDASLEWMANAAKGLGLKCDDTVLHWHPDPAGMQHDETKSSLVFRVESLFRTKPRAPDKDAPLHETVLARFEIDDGVQKYDYVLPYRPTCLKDNKNVACFFKADDFVKQFGAEAASEADRRATDAQQHSNAEEAEQWKRVKLEIERRSRAHK